MEVVNISRSDSDTETANEAFERLSLIRSSLALKNDKEKRLIKPCGTLNDLISELYDVFESDSVNIDYVHDLMTSYKSNPLEWKKFAKFDRLRYTRNLVDEGNGKFSLMILCWGEGQVSPIHDHSNSHCFMKMLHGELSEVRYAWPEEQDKTKVLQEDLNCLNELSRTRLQKNSVCYINDSLGLHRVENPSHVNTAVSLHLYSPPFDSCSIFNLRTGQRSKSKVTFWSKFGKKRNEEIEKPQETENN